MAKANLHISPEVEASFIAAQDESSVIRILKVAIDRETLVLAASVDSVGGPAEDFDTVLPSVLSETEASLILYSLDNAGIKGRKWLLLAWVPDGCRVRDKMLYSSSREDLKRSLGLGYFSAEYAANQLSDVRWVHFQAYIKKDGSTDHLLSEAERLVEEEKSLVRGESMQAKSTAMGVLPFTLGPSVQDEFQRFVSGDINWIELSLDNEVIHLQAAKVVDISDNLQAHVNADSARFLLFRFANNSNKNITFFVYSCPESVSVRIKMTMSSSKATVIASAVTNGIILDKTLEIRGADEIVDVVQQELGIREEAASGAASAAAVLSHSKPQRPGRGRARVSKFQGDSTDS